MRRSSEDLQYKRVLVKLSGEALLGDELYGIDPVVIGQVSAEIGALVAQKSK